LINNEQAIIICVYDFPFSCNVGVGYRVNEKPKPAAIAGEFNWLVGNWIRTNEKADRTTYESWEKVNETEYIGVGFTLQKKDTIWKENIRLAKIENHWNFEVVAGDEAKPTIFRLTSIEREQFVCENKENEFPKKIEYKKEGDQIKAKISGGEVEIPFEFERIQEQK